MRQLRGGLGLTTEALDEERIGAEFGVEDLERHGPIEQKVLGPIDHRHAAARDEVSHLIAVRIKACVVDGLHTPTSLRRRLGLSSRSYLTRAGRGGARGRLSGLDGQRALDEALDDRSGHRCTVRSTSPGYGIMTATATVGCDAGAKAIIQSSVWVLLRSGRYRSWRPPRPGAGKSPTQCR